MTARPLGVPGEIARAAGEGAAGWSDGVRGESTDGATTPSAPPSSLPDSVKARTSSAPIPFNPPRITSVVIVFRKGYLGRTIETVCSDREIADRFVRDQANEREFVVEVWQVDEHERRRQAVARLGETVPIHP